jgi:hypothetical protein
VFRSGIPIVRAVHGSIVRTHDDLSDLFVQALPFAALMTRMKQIDDKLAPFAAYDSFDAAAARR